MAKHFGHLTIILVQIFAICSSADQNTIFPNLLLIGQAKAGSTAIGVWLLRNGVCGAKVFPGEPAFISTKEVHFFTQDWRFTQGASFYADRFRHCNASWVMDATPTVFSQAPRVRSFYRGLGPKERVRGLHVIFLLREPIARAVSMYNHMISAWEKDGKASPLNTFLFNPNGTMRSFEQFAMRLPKRLARGTFDNFAPVDQVLREWLRFIHPQNILLLSYDELHSTPHVTLQRLTEFLSLNATGKLTHENAREHPSKMKRVPCDLRDKLDAKFKPQNEALMHFLQHRRGPPSEQHPLEKFHPAQCS